MDDGVNQNTLQGGAAEGGPPLEHLSEELLTELARSLKAVLFYPRGHPTLQTALDKAYRILASALARREQLSFGITKDGFVFDSHPLAPGNQTLQGFAREFFLRQIKKIFFLREVDIHELENFLRVIAMEEDLFRGKGKAETYLNDSGVTHIWANEIKMSQGGGLPRREEAPPDPVEVDARIQQLIEALRAETDPRKYLTLAREASITAQRFIAEGKLDTAFVFMKVFWEGFNSEPPRADMIANGSRTAFRELATPEMMEYLLRQLTLLDGPRKEEILKVSMGLGPDLVNAILKKLATNEALYSHRALIQILIAEPEFSRGPIEMLLDDDRWWVARKMAFLLGEMNAIGSVDALIRLSSHPDTRVQKEVLKSLSKIQSPEGIKRLIDIVESKEPIEIRTHAIRLVGAAGERSATPALIRVLKGRGAFLDNVELLEEAIRALGKIGSTQAVPVLSEILLKRNLFAKAKSLNLGVEAAEALGVLGGQDAVEALEKGTESKQQEIKLASMKALKQLQPHPGQNGNGNGEKE